MTDVWCPFATRAPIPGHNGAGPLHPAPPKIVHHTTEGSSYGGAFSTYKVTGGYPHFTDTFEADSYEVYQHLPIDVTATALAHPAGTGETNRDNALQIEHVGFASTSYMWQHGYLDGIARLCRWIEEQTGCYRAAAAPFGTHPARLDWASWHMACGHLGHVHVP